MEQNKTMRRGPMGQARGPAPVEKAKNFRATLKKLFYYLAKYKFVLLVVIYVQYFQLFLILLDLKY